MTIPLRIPERAREPVLWGSVAVALFILFVIATFPYQALHARVLTELSRASGMEVQVADWSAGFPVAVEWHDIVLTGAKGGAIRCDSLHARLAVMPALVGALGLDLVVQFPKSTQPEQGRVTGTVKATSWSLQGPAELKVRWQQIDLPSLLRQYVSRGIMQGEGLHRWGKVEPGPSGMKEEGIWKAEVKELIVEPIPLGQGFSPPLSFTRVSTVMTCRQALCDVTELKGEGPDGSFTVQGQFTMKRPIERSLLALTVSVLPGVGLSQKLGSLGLPPLQPGAPFVFKVLGPANEARVAI